MMSVFQSFEFVFGLHLTNEIFGYTNDLYNALQRRDQNIINAMDLLEFTKVELDILREGSRWKSSFRRSLLFVTSTKLKLLT